MPKLIEITGTLKFISQWKQIHLIIDQKEYDRLTAAEYKTYETESDEGEVQYNLKLSLTKYLKVDDAVMLLEDAIGKTIRTHVQVKRWVGEDDGSPCVAYMVRRWKVIKSKKEDECEAEV